MKFISFFIFILFSYNSNALSIKCDFEEVYQNGETQQGFFLLKKRNLRYEYLDQNLYTILYLNNRLFVSENANRYKTQFIENQSTVFPSIMEIYDDYPNIQDTYFIKGYKIKIELGSNNFIKRISINSQELKLSIYLLDCRNENLPNKYFNFNPVIEYVQN
jgi:hypothetical protein